MSLSIYACEPGAVGFNSVVVRIHSKPLPWSSSLSPLLHMPWSGTPFLEIRQCQADAQSEQSKLPFYLPATSAIKLKWSAFHLLNYTILKSIQVLKLIRLSHAFKVQEGLVRWESCRGIVSVHCLSELTLSDSLQFWMKMECNLVNQQHWTPWLRMGTFKLEVKRRSGGIKPSKNSSSHDLKHCTSAMWQSAS